MLPGHHDEARREQFRRGMPGDPGIRRLNEAVPAGHRAARAMIADAVMRMAVTGIVGVPLDCGGFGGLAVVRRGLGGMLAIVRMEGARRGGRVAKP